MPATTKDYYRILGVSEDASEGEIKKAYRRLAKRYHPDAHPDDAEAAERFKEVGEAYAVLSDAEKREQYDQVRKMGGPAGFAGARGAHGGRTAGAREFEFSLDDLGDLGGGLGDIFGSMFERGAAGSPGATARRRGRDIDYTVDVPFLTAARGGALTIAVPVTDECAACGGTGNAPGSRSRTCPECGGDGTVSFGQGGFAVNRPCPACHGRGQVPIEPCPSCGGSGQVRERREIRLSVPAGADTGSKVRLSGKGEPGANGGPPGDLLVTFNVEPHRFFRRDGLDILCTIPLNIAQATLGSKVRVRTIGGNRVTLRIPPGTDSGTRLRIRGQGIEKQGRRGDQYVETKIVAPDELDADAERLMGEFARAAELKH